MEQQPMLTMPNQGGPGGKAEVFLILDKLPGTLQSNITSVYTKAAAWRRSKAFSVLTSAVDPAKEATATSGLAPNLQGPGKEK